MDIEFTAHNIRLDDGSLTKPEAGHAMEQCPVFLSAKHIFEVLLPGDKSCYSIVDLGCLEGGYATEFARLGFDVLGIEIRDSNMAACRYVKSRVNLPKLKFVQDNAWNIARYGDFDAVFCSGLLYHLDQPRRFMDILSRVTKKILIIDTHFSTSKESQDEHNLSPITENEGLQGRWYTEFADEASFSKREESRWAAWDNRRSFWLKKECLLQSFKDAGFGLVFEHYDGFTKNKENRGIFIGVK